MDASQIVSTGLMVAALGFAIVVDARNNPMERSNEYIKRRRRNWLVNGAAYAVFYAARYNVSIVNTAAVRDLLGVTKEEYGHVLIAGFWSYAVGQLVNGTLVDRYGGKRSLLLGGAGTMVVNAVSAILFHGGHQTAKSLLALNVFNNIFQPFGSLSTVKLNTLWFTKRERGVFSGIFGTMISLGYWIALVTGGWVFSTMPLYFSFAKPAILMAFMLVCVHCFVAESPEDAGLEVHEEEQPAMAHMTASRRELTRKTPMNVGDADGGDGTGAAAGAARAAAAGAGSGAAAGATAAAVDEAGVTDKGVKVDPEDPSEPPVRPGLLELLRVIVTNPHIIIVAVAMCCVGWAREGFLSWFTSYLEEEVGVAVGSPLYTAAATGITLGGVFGSMAGGYISDACFQSRRGPVVLSYFVLEAVMLMAFYYGSVEPVVTVVCMTLFSVFLFGTLTMLVASASTDLAGTKAAGTASGFVNACQYIASGSSAATMGWAIDHYGWDAWLLALAPAPLIGAGCMIVLMRMTASAKAADAAAAAAEEEIEVEMRSGSFDDGAGAGDGDDRGGRSGTGGGRDASLSESTRRR